MVDVVVLVVVFEVETVVTLEEEEAEVLLDHMILWRAIVVGCMAIWPATVPNQRSRKGVAMLCPPVEDSHNPVRKGQGIVDEGGRLGLVQWGSYTMMRDMNIPLMTTVNYTFPITPRRLLPLE